MNFSTGRIIFQEDTYEAYFNNVQKLMQNIFQNNNHYSETLRVPPIYRKQIIEYLQQNYPQYEFFEYEIGGICVKGDLDANIRYCVNDVEQGNGIIHADQKYIEQILLALRNKFPEKKFEIEKDEDIYEGTNCDYDKGRRCIIVDDFEIYNKWFPVHFVGDFSDWLTNEILNKIEKGEKIIHTDHNEMVVDFLKKRFPNKTFEIKNFCDVFYWLDAENRSWRKNDMIIIIDDFVVPTPKKVQKNWNNF